MYSRLLYILHTWGPLILCFAHNSVDQIPTMRIRPWMIDLFIYDICIKLKFCLEQSKKLKIQYLENTDISCFWFVILIFTCTYILQDRQRKLFIITDVESFSSLHFAVSVCNKSSLSYFAIFCFMFSAEMNWYVIFSSSLLCYHWFLLLT